MPKVNKTKKKKKKRKTYKEMMNEIINKQAPDTGVQKDVESIKQSVGGGTVSKVDKI